MANTTAFPLTISILGDGASTTAVVGVASSPSSASLVSSFDHLGADVSGNIVSVVPSGSNVTLTFTAPFSGVILVTIGLVYSQIVNAQLQPISHPNLPNVDVLLSTRTKPSDVQQIRALLSSDVVTVAALTAALPAGANVIGHTIADTGSTTAVTGNVTIVQPTGTSLHAVLDTTSTTAVTQATGTNLHTVVDSGTITAVTAITNALPVGANIIGKVDLLGNAGAILDGATGAAVPANVIYNGARAATANPTNATGGNLVGIMADKAGRLVVTSGHVRDLQGTQTTTIAASGTETTIVTAGAAGVFHDICMLVISGQSTVNTVWTLRSATAGTFIASFNAPVGATALPLVIKFDPPLAQPIAANNWTIQAGTGTSTGCQIFVHYITNT
jgi:hypothetical protein